MKKLINRIVNYIKKNYIASTVVAAIVFVLLGSFIIISLINMNKNKIIVRSENANLYQFFREEKKEFDAKLSYENDKMVNIKSNDYKPYSGSPLYDKNSQKIILPSTSSIVFYHRQNLAYRLPKYSTLTFNEGSSFISSNGNIASASGFFIFDGVDTYIMPVASVLKYNNKEIALSAYSYVIANENGITYYNYETDKATVVETSITRALVIIDDVGIDLLKNATVINNDVQLILSNIDRLSIYLEDKNGK